MNVNQNPGNNMLSSSSISSSNPNNKSHLVVVAHGLVGRAKDLDYLVRRLRLTSPDLYILATSVNEGFKTYDGVLAGAERIANDVIELINIESNEFTSISFIGNSLGGLYVRAGKI